MKFTVVFIGVFLLYNNLKGQDFEVSPTKLEFDAEPSTSQTKTINVKNHGSKKVAFTIVISDFLPSTTGEKKPLPPNSTKRSAANWLNINPSFFELNPNETAVVQVSMLVPGEEYGASWCMIYVQPTREQSSWDADKALQAGVAISSRIGIQVSQTPKSNTNQSVRISNFTQIESSVSNKMKFTATLENLGDRISKCKVFLLASNMATAEEKKYPAMDYEVFPKMSRNIELELPNDLAPGTYALAAIVDYGPKFPLEGAQIVIEVKGNARTITPDTTSVKKQ